MADTQQLTQEELQFFQSLNNDYSSVRAQLGAVVLEIDRLQTVESQLKDTNQQLVAKEREYIQQLQEKYGPGSIDLSTGKYTPAESTPVISAD